MAAVRRQTFSNLMRKPIIMTRVGDATEKRRLFSLTQARALLPLVQEMTAEAVRHAEELADALDSIAEDDPERPVLGAELKMVADDWAARIREMGLEARGLWLVDFDNGEGYYCWQHPESSVSHYHGYEEGFAGRMKIV
jgi:hypothetical protein